MVVNQSERAVEARVDLGGLPQGSLEAISGENDEVAVVSESLIIFSAPFSARIFRLAP